MPRVPATRACVRHPNGSLMDFRRDGTDSCPYLGQHCEWGASSAASIILQTAVPAAACLKTFKAASIEGPAAEEFCAETPFLAVKSSADALEQNAKPLQTKNRSGQKPDRF